MSDSLEKNKILLEDEQIELLRKKCMRRDIIWRIMSVLSVMCALVYFILYLYGIVPRDLDLIVYILIALGILSIIFLCVYMLPSMLQINKNRKNYSTKYKHTYLKPLIEDAFKSADYDSYDKVSIKDITEMSMLKKAKSAVANDCIEGEYKKVKFNRFDLALTYGNDKQASDCVLIVTKIKSGIDGELQIISKDFEIGGESYQMPEGLTLVKSNRESFDKHYNIFASNKDAADKYLSNSFMKKLEKVKFGGPVAILVEEKKIYAIIRRKKDIMEAPIYKKASRDRAEKEAKEEIDIIKDWILILSQEL